MSSVFDKLKSLMFPAKEENADKNVMTKTKDRTNAKKALKEDRKAYKEKLQKVKTAENFYDNTTIKPNDREGLWYRLKSIAGNTSANVTTTPLHAAGLIGALGAYPFLKTYSKITGSDEDVFLPSLDNPFSRAGEALERQIRSDVGINQLEEMDRPDQLINLGSMFVGPSASKTDNLLTSMLKPGLQITKDASKLGKATQIGTQLGIPTAMNEAMRKANEQVGILGDYREKLEEQPQNLVLASRSNAKVDKIYDVTINPEEPEEKTLGDYVKTGAKVIAPIAAIGAARHTKMAKNLVQRYRNAKISNKNAIKFDETLSLGEKVLNTVDTKNITENALKKGFIDEKTANELYRNTYQQTINSYDTGTLYLGDNIYQTRTAPRWVVRDVQALAQTNPKEYEIFNTFMNNARILQTKVYEYNKANGTKYTVYDAITKPGIAEHIKTPDGKSILDDYRILRFLHKQILKDNVFTKPLTEISDINNKLISLGVQTGEFSEEFAKELRNNRTLFDLNLYVPGIKEQQEVKGFDKFLEKFGNIFSNDTMYKKGSIFATNKRLDNKTMRHIAPWDTTFENNYKNTVKRLLDNHQKRMLVKSLEENRNTKIQKSIEDIKELQKTVTYENSREIGGQIADIADTIPEQFDTIKYLGEIDSDTGRMYPNTNPLFKTLNKTSKDITALEQSLNNSIQNVENQNLIQTLLDEKTKAKYIAVPKDNKIKLYEVNDWFGQIVQQDPQTAGLIYNTARGMTNAMKSFVTGKFNPLFSMVTGSYTLTDQLTGLTEINKALDTSFSKSDVIRNAGKNIIPTTMFKSNANELEKIYKGFETGKLTRTPENLQKARKLELAIRNTDLNKIKSTGATIQGRYPVDVNKQRISNIDDGFVVNSSETLDNLAKKVSNSKLINNAAVDAEVTGIKMAKYSLESLRDAPTLGIYKTLSPVFKTKDGKIDTQKILSISRLLDKYTATGSLMAAQTKAGKVVQGMYDIVPYFSDMVSENLARGRMAGFKNVADHFINLIDKDKKLSTELASIGKGITGNNFVKAGTSVVAMPTILASIWNHATPENEEAYDLLPDAYKNKGIVFANAINGKPIVIPMTQSLMWIVTALREGVTDPILRVNENAYNASDNFGYRLKETAGINWGVSMPPIAGLAFNALGYRSPNTTELIEAAKDKQFALDNYKLYNLNYNEGSYYDKGVFSPKQRAMIQTLFGNPGAAVSEAIDITASQKDPLKGLEAGLTKYATTGFNLLNPKASTWSATSEELYKKKEAFNLATRKKDLTPAQDTVLGTIKMYQNSRLNLIDQEIKSLRKQINEIKNTGKTSDNENLSYSGMQTNVNDLTKQIKLLQSHKIKEYENLDKLLKQQYNTTYDEFMESLK